LVYARSKVKQKKKGKVMSLSIALTGFQDQFLSLSFLSILFLGTGFIGAFHFF
jgi:hypothetical protein